MQARTGTIIRYTSFGVLIGIVMAAMNVQGGGGAGDAGRMIGIMIGSILGGALITGVIGYIISRGQPAEANIPPLSKARKVLLWVCLCIFLGAIGSIGAVLYLVK